MTDKWYVIEKRLELPTDQKFHGLRRDSEYEKLSSEDVLGVILDQVPMDEEERALVESLPQVKKVYEGGYVYANVSRPFDQGKSHQELDNGDFEVEGLRDLDFHRVKKAHDYGYKGQGSKVSVIDTGFDRDHYEKTYGPLGKIIELKDFSNSGTGPWDYAGHGTHVLGTIIDDKYGVAPEAKAFVAKGLGDNGSGSYAGIIKALEWSIYQGVDVVNMSLSGGGAPDSPLSRAVDVASDKGVNIVVAAGNEGCATKTSEENTPSNAARAVTVAAVDTNSRLANFSSCGKNVNIAGAGVSVESLGLRGSISVKSGTSMATPHVAGILLLFRGDDARVRENVLYNTARDSQYDAINVGVGVADAYSYVTKMAEKVAPIEEPSDNPLERLPRKTRWDVCYGGLDDSLAVVTDYNYEDRFVVLPLHMANEVLSGVDISSSEEPSNCGSQPTLSKIMKDGWEDRKAWKNCRKGL